MPTINLLPPEERNKEQKELERAKKSPKRVEVVLTNPEKNPRENPMEIRGVVRSSFWKRLFSPSPISKKKSPPSDKPVVAVPLPTPSLAKSAPTPPRAKSSAPATHWWSQLFRARDKIILVPPSNSKAQPVAPPPASVANSPNLLRARSTLPLPPISPLTLPTANGNKPQKPMPKPPDPGKSFVTIPKGHHVKFTNVGSETTEKGPGSVTLLPEELRPKEGQIETKLVLLVVASLIVSSAIVGGGLYVVNIFKVEAEHELTIARSEAEELSRDKNNKMPLREKGEALQATLASTSKLLDQHLYWSKWFQALEERTHEQVQWKKMEYKAADRTIKLQGLGTSLTVVAQQIVAFRKTPQVARVTITAAKKESGQKKTAGGFSFDALLELNETYSVDLPANPDDPAATRSIQYGVITTTAQEANVNVKEVGL